VPAEHIKVITHTMDAKGNVRTKINQYDVLMPGLSKMWSFYPPNIEITHGTFESGG
jgi:hypothetical protein